MNTLELFVSRTIEKLKLKGNQALNFYALINQAHTALIILKMFKHLRQKALQKAT